jgi:transmembrane sensor
MADPATPPDDVAWIHAVRVVADELPSEEAARMRAWLEGSAEGRAALREADALWRAAQPLAQVTPPAWDTAAAMRRFRRARVSDPAQRSPGARRSGMRGRWGFATGLAAAALVLAVVWQGAERGAQGSGPATTVAVNTAAGAAPQTVRLPDGSTVVLAPGSTLMGAPGFGAAHRELRLSGEGYFTVAPGARPFRVRLQSVVVEDLSTAFAVRPSGNDALVTVVEGAVVAGARRDTIREATAARVSTEGATQRLGADVAQRELAWTRGTLAFDEAPLAEIAERIARWSGRTVEVSPELARRRLTVTFSGEGLQEMVQVLATTLGGRAEITQGGWRLVGALP